MPKTLLGICALIYVLDGLLHSLLGPLAPDIARTLALTSAQLGPVFSANLLGQCIGLVLLPLVAGRLGQRNVVLLSLVGFGLAQAAAATSGGATSLMTWRLIEGIFLGGCLPSCLALVTAAAPAARRGLSIMILFTGYGLGATLAGLVAAAFADLGGWRAAMLATGAACLVVAACGALLLPADRSPAPDEANAPGGARQVVQILSPRYLPGTVLLWLLFIFLLTVSYCLASWLPTMLVEVGRDERFAALSVSMFSLGGIVSALGVGLLIDRFGARPTLVVFLSAATLLLLLVGRVLATAPGPLLMTLLAACGFFFLGAYGGVNVVLATYYPEPLRATGIGWAKSVGRIGTLIAPVLIGTALTAGMAVTAIMSWFALPALLAMLSLLGIGLHQRRIASL